eukprot:11790427-Alexandrium_andersonii.AAC.1
MLEAEPGWRTTAKEPPVSHGSDDTPVPEPPQRYAQRLGVPPRIGLRAKRAGGSAPWKCVALPRRR